MRKLKDKHSFGGIDGLELQARLFGLQKLPTRANRRLASFGAGRVHCPAQTGELNGLTLQDNYSVRGRE
jgi:hypothetical protein